MNWDDATERHGLIECVGIAEYNRQMQAHLAASVLCTVSGHDIRPVGTMQFGTLYAVGKTGKAFNTQEQAEQYGHTIDEGDIEELVHLGDENGDPLCGDAAGDEWESTPEREDANCPLCLNKEVSE